MALVDNAWYVNFGDGSTTGYYAVAQFATAHAYAAGNIIRQLAAPAVGNERCFICVVAGTSAGAEPAWTVTRGATTVSNTATFQECTGIAAINGDLTNTPTWTTVKGTAITKGQVIQRNSGASYQICTTAGTAGSGSEPAFSDTAGTTTADNTATWTSLGAVGNFTGWQAPHARMSNACASTWAQAGNKIYIADNHAEISSAVINCVMPGTPASPNYVFCVDHTAAVPPTAANITTGASISVTTGNVANALSGSGMVHGLTLQGATTGGGSSHVDIGITAGNCIYLKDCALKLRNSSAVFFIFGQTSNGVKVTLDNTPLTFGNNSSQSILVQNCDLTWRNTASALSWTTMPLGLIGGVSSTTAKVLLEGVDLSNFTGYLVSGAFATPSADFVIKDCKLNASATLQNQSPTSPSYTGATLIRSHSGNTNYNMSLKKYEGDLTTETTIVRTGGATDGITSVSWKLVTTANSTFFNPFKPPPIRIWNDTTSGNVSVTIYGIWGGGAVPNNDDIWFDVEYLGDASFPMGSFATCGKATYLTAATALDADSSTWGGSTTKFKKTVTIAPRQKGYIYVYVKAATSASTFYIDPKPVLT